MSNVIYDPVVGTLIAKPEYLLTYYDTLSYHEKLTLCIIINNITEFENNIKDESFRATAKPIYSENNENKLLITRIYSSLEYHTDLILSMIKYLSYDDCIKYVQIIIKYCTLRPSYCASNGIYITTLKNLINNNTFVSVITDSYINNNDIDSISCILANIKEEENSIPNILLILKKIESSYLRDKIIFKLNNDFNRNMFEIITGSLRYRYSLKYRYVEGYMQGYSRLLQEYGIIDKLLTSPYNFKSWENIKDTSLIKDIKEFTKLMKIMTANTGISFKSLFECLSQPTIKMMHIKTLIKYTMKLNIIMTEDMFEDIYTSHTLNLGFIPPVFSPDEMIYI